MTTHSVFLRRAATVFCAVVWLAAATATHIPMESLSDVPVGDVVLHFIGYLGLACVFLLTLRVYGVRLSRRILLTIPILLLYGVLDETTQPLVNRNASIHDWLADAAGVSAACLLDAAAALLQRLWKHW